MVCSDTSSIAELAGKGRNLDQVRDLGAVEGVVDLTGAKLGLAGPQGLPDLAKFHAYKGLRHSTPVYHASPL